MLVSKLVQMLLQLPQDVEVEVNVNDNCGGEVYEIEGVDYFRNNASVIIQVNC
jgi:hypothetical protein